MNRRPDHGGPHGVSATEAMEWHAGRHSAVLTDDYLFSQLIPYIGNKRKLLGLIAQAIAATGKTPPPRISWTCSRGPASSRVWPSRWAFAC
ncbi:hypothetical protein RAA17_20535 [Komagataeibacter rhaeticus]|nr:hypothetical protein [Komagataeibacter rhaeticus]